MRPLLVLAALLAAPDPEEGSRRDEWQYLTNHFNVDAFAEANPPRNAGFDNTGIAFRPEGLPEGERLVVRSDRYGEIQFLRPPTDGDSFNMVSCMGQEIRVTTKRVFNVLFTLGSAHHGEHYGWIEFTFEDGTKGRGPFGFSDWWIFEGLLGEEVAFTMPIAGRPGTQPAGGGARIWLQRTPIPQEKRIVSIKLPGIPNAKILALTLGWRDGVRPIEPPLKTQPAPGRVAIFGETCFPYYTVRGDLTPERLKTAFDEAGIPAAILSFEHLMDANIFNPKNYPVFVNPYGNTFPLEAEENLRAYRKAGGGMVHLGIPFTHPVVRTPYGNWIDRGHNGDYALHEGAHAVGVGGFMNCTYTEVVPQPEIATWGLGETPWDLLWRLRVSHPPMSGFGEPQGVHRGSLQPTDEVVPLYVLKTFEQDPLAAVVRHKSCEFAGCIDARLASMCHGLEHLDWPVTVTVQLVVRAAASILHEKKILDDDAWARITRPLPENLRTPEEIEPVARDPAWGWRLPRTASTAKKALVIDVAPLSLSERVLLASAQGLINRSGGEVSAYLSDGRASQNALEEWKKEGLLEEVTPLSLDQTLEIVGHRKSVIFDPELRGSLNLAVMVASVEGLLVAAPHLVEKHKLEAAADLRGTFKSQAECYAWAFENLWPLLDHRALAMVEPDLRSYHVIDYLMASKTFVFWLSWGRDASFLGASREEEIPFASKLLARSPVAIPVLVTPTAAPGATAVSFFSRFGKYQISLDGLPNLSFTSGLAPATARPAETAKPGSEAPRPKLHGKKVYLSAIGDEAFTQRLFSQTGEESPEKAGVSGLTLQLTSGWILAPTAASLFPPLAARVKGCIGSPGLGDVEPSLLGNAFTKDVERVRKAYWELVDRSMADLGQKFLVLRRWQSPAGAEMAACARAVNSAQVIFPAFLGTANLRGMEPTYLLEGKPVVHAVSAGPEPFLPDGIGTSPFATLRPGFSWCFSQPTGMPFDLDVVLVEPAELGALAKEHLEAVAKEKVPLVAQGSTWKYDDTGKDLGAAWRASDFDDSKWSSGAATLGYGEASQGRPEKTVISFGTDAKNKHICAYFRHAFDVPDPSDIQRLSLQVLRDDGCVVYLNGREVARSNMPDGEISFGTLAVKAIGGDDEMSWQGFDLDNTFLRKGKNVIAVEVHQSGATSTDLTFDLKLTAYRKKPEPADAPPPKKKGQGD